ncbi:hypothetical protein QBC39DRAFT_26998 [Podospora conica]|nr:hypothetical protein QBC39DRAFT_26998 [Schizothecium conicum]
MTFLRVGRHSIRRKREEGIVQGAPPHGSPGMGWRRPCALSLSRDSTATRPNRSWGARGHGNLPQWRLWAGAIFKHTITPLSLPPPPTRLGWLSHLTPSSSWVTIVWRIRQSDRWPTVEITGSFQRMQRAADELRIPLPAASWIYAVLPGQERDDDGKGIYRIGLAASTICRGCPPTTPPLPPPPLLWFCRVDPNRQDDGHCIVSVPLTSPVDRSAPWMLPR